MENITFIAESFRTFRDLKTEKVEGISEGRHPLEALLKDLKEFESYKGVYSIIDTSLGKPYIGAQYISGDEETKGTILTCDLNIGIKAEDELNVFEFFVDENWQIDEKGFNYSEIGGIAEKIIDSVEWNELKSSSEAIVEQILEANIKGVSSEREVGLDM